MRTILCALVAMVVALPAWAEDREFDLGFARPGMAQDQFRASQWGEGTVLCSNDSDHPREVDFALPKGVARVGAARCGLFRQDASSQWRALPVPIAGWPGEVWALFLPDAAGTLRLVHLKLNLPGGAFDDLAKSWDQLFGLPSFRRDRVVHWSNARNDAVIVGEGDSRVHAYVMDNALHDSTNRRLGQMPALH